MSWGWLPFYTGVILLVFYRQIADYCTRAQDDLWPYNWGAPVWNRWSTVFTGWFLVGFGLWVLIVKG